MPKTPDTATQRGAERGVERDRERALSTQESFIVQAPAGSGKTELLTQRFLKLLGEVEQPEQVLAITFTRAATAEMRARVIGALERARDTKPGASEDASLCLARMALRNAAAREWNLLKEPQRLNIQTIDSLCMTIAHQAPLLSGLGATLLPTEYALPMYTQAARRTLQRLGGDSDELSDAIGAMLRLRDTSLADCEALIADMLEQRDQWGRVLPLGRDLDWVHVRARLEEPLIREHERALVQAHKIFADQSLASELLDLLRFACGNLRSEGRVSRVTELAGLRDMDAFTDLDHWRCLCEFLLTKSNGFRGEPDVRQGFPSGQAGKPFKDRFKSLLRRLEQHEGALEALRALRDLPPALYDDEQWTLLRHILVILRYAAAELRLMFAERGTVDFVELGITARQVLEQENDVGPSEEAVRLAERWRHLLVDEFQDTSRAQHESLTLLVSAWESAGAGTCFLVGDPMQSIYMFRQAEVELFNRVQVHGLAEGHAKVRLSTLRLRTNFRSRPALVRELNEIFTAVCAPNGARPHDEAVAFEPAVAAAASEPRHTRAVHLWPQFLPPKATPEERQKSDELEAEQVVSIIQQHLPRLQRAQEAGKEFRVAVLVRAKNHAFAIASRLRNLGIPFRSVEIEELTRKQEVLDLTSLARALVHPLDRIAWLSILRAPWCGLSLHDLHILTGSDDRSFKHTSVLELLRTRTSLLSAQGQVRAGRVAVVLEQAIARAHQQTWFAQWVERAWYTLGGPACVDANGFENAQVFFRMLDELTPDGSACLGDELDQALARLFAEPDPRASERCGVQLMTIHKAKGLGFDVVIAPGLHRKPASDDQKLLAWLERTMPDGSSQFLVAPIGVKGGDKDPLYSWVTKQRSRKADEETKRLLYVACTRAKEELHLLGTAVEKPSTHAGTPELNPGPKNSLLAVAWPALQERYVAEWQRLRAQRALPFSSPTAPNGVVQLAAAAAAPEPATIQLRRLPVDWTPLQSESTAAARPPLESSEREPFARPEGSLKARAFGTAVHALLEKLAALSGAERGELETAVENLLPAARSLLRHAGLPMADANTQAAEVVRLLRATVHDRTGRWILSPHAKAQTEASWTGWVDGRLQTVRGDRTFFAGPEPGTRGATHLWIIDYKTTRFEGADVAGFLAKEREKYEKQLAAYARMMRLVYGEAQPVCLGLYYPAVKRLVWWPAPYDGAHPHPAPRR